MTHHSNRRNFIRNILTGIAGSSLLLEAGKEALLAKADASLPPRPEGKPHLPESYWRLVKKNFPFEPNLLYFNNASLGPSPEIVRDATESFRRTLDSFPSKYMWGGWQDDKEQVRTKAANLLGASAEEIALIHNTTEGMNVIASSLDLKPGDEVILADHEHTSGTIPWQYWQETKGIKLIRPVLPILPKTPDQIVKVYADAITPNTKVISMCHVVNTNGMILPVGEVSKMARKHGVIVAVDGAQAPGMLTMNLHHLDCDFYAASSHKWLFSPKGMGIFYARKESQHLIKPLIVCRGYDDPSIRRFENYNTRNLPELLGLGTALDFQHLIGPKAIENRILQLKDYFLTQISTRPHLKLKTPSHPNLSAGIQTVELINHPAVQTANRLMADYTINLRPMTTHNLNALRVSLSIYTTKQDIDRLLQSLDTLATT